MFATATLRTKTLPSDIQKQNDNSDNVKMFTRLSRKLRNYIRC